MEQKLRNIFLVCTTVLLIFDITEAYSKYGRKCEDIGCLNSEICVMENDPCSYGRSTECGSYPTCKPAKQLSCSNFDCPAGQECHVTNGKPECTSSHSVPSHMSNSQSDNQPNGGSAMRPNGGYPDGTTSRPRPGGAYSGGSGYMGGQPGSGYPGGQPGSGYPGGQPGSGYPGARPGSGYPGAQPGVGYPGGQAGSGYPGGYNAGGGYPGRGGYPNQGYPGQVYPNQGYPGQSYPNSQGGYSGYPNQGGYPAYQQPGQQQHSPNYNQQRPRPSEANSFTSKLTEGLKVFAGNYLKDTLTKAITQQFQPRQ